MKKITGLTAIGGGLIFFSVTVLIVMLLWNAIMPSLMQVGKVNFLEAAGLKILFNQLFSHKVTNIRDILNKKNN